MPIHSTSDSSSRFNVVIQNAANFNELLGNLPAELVAQVKGVLAKNRWEIAPEKEHIAELPARLKVHGLLVHGPQPRLTKGYRNKIRAYRHLVASGKISTVDISRIQGHISYADHVEKASSQ